MKFMRILVALETEAAQGRREPVPAGRKADDRA
jgi:hypothetical protein